jgi:hypothetical protein
MHEDRKRRVTKSGPEDDQGAGRRDELYGRRGSAGNICLEAENGDRAGVL